MLQQRCSSASATLTRCPDRFHKATCRCETHIAITKEQEQTAATSRQLKIPHGFQAATEGVYRIGLGHVAIEQNCRLGGSGSIRVCRADLLIPYTLYDLYLRRNRRKAPRPPRRIAVRRYRRYRRGPRSNTPRAAGPRASPAGGTVPSRSRRQSRGAGTGAGKVGGRPPCSSPPAAPRESTTGAGAVQTSE